MHHRKNSEERIHKITCSFLKTSFLINQYLQINDKNTSTIIPLIDHSI